MNPDNQAINNLLEALNFSPNNVPLRLHVAQLLIQAKRFSEAEEQLKKVLGIDANHLQAKQNLAKVFLLQGKHTTAFVIVEDLLSMGTPPPSVYLLHAQLLFETKDFQHAQEEYKKAIALAPNLRDLAFENQLNQQADAANEASGRSKMKHDLDAELDDLIAEVERPKINFSDVGGMDKVKEEIEMKIVMPLKHPELYKAYGKAIGGGILMYGPPGCGKTHLARATAGEVQAGFITVGINDILDMWVGNSEKNLHQIFELARQQAPCVLFFDEVDALGANRTDMKRSAGRQLINQFLSEMDGINSNNDGVLILAATNTPWHLDPAFRRPGRFDRMIFVAPPDEPARKAIFEIELKGKPVDSFKLDKVANKAKSFSGADIKAVIDVAVEAKLRESMRAKRPLPIEQKDLLSALKKVKPSTKEWFSTARNYALYANEGGIYDDILHYLKLKK